MAGALLQKTQAGLACGPLHPFQLLCVHPLLEGQGTWPLSWAAWVSWIHQVLGMLFTAGGFLALPWVMVSTFQRESLPPSFKRPLLILPFGALLLLLLQAIHPGQLSAQPSLFQSAMMGITLAFMGKISLLVEDLNETCSWPNLKDLLSLAKAPLLALVMLTVLAGLATAPPVPLGKALGGLSLIALVVAGAAFLNAYLERNIDALMKRTQDRPLPAGRVPPQVALTLGLLLVLVPLPLLHTTANPLTAFLCALAAGLYILAYTPLKTRTPLALFVGAVPGALPPVLGRVVSLGQTDPLSWHLFALLFLWQIPHFLAISLHHVKDYSKTPFLVYGTLWNFHQTVRAIVFFTLLLAFVSLVPLGQERSLPYYIFAGFLNLAFVLLALRGFWKERFWARAYFFGSLFYLPLLLCAMISLNK